MTTFDSLLHSTFFGCQLSPIIYNIIMLAPINNSLMTTTLGKFVGWFHKIMLKISLNRINLACAIAIVMYRHILSVCIIYKLVHSKEFFQNNLETNNAIHDIQISNNKVYNSKWSLLNLSQANFSPSIHPSCIVCISTVWSIYPHSSICFFFFVYFFLVHIREKHSYTCELPCDLNKLFAWPKYNLDTTWFCY